MKSLKTITVLLICACLASIAPGCTPVNKVKRTLALNDLHIQASVAEGKGDDATAYELWSEYVDRRPHSPLAEYRLGSVETRLGKYAQAAGHLRIAHDLKPGNIEYLEALANTLLLAGRTEALMKLLHNTLNEGGGSSGYLRLARYAQQIGQMDEAREALLLAIAHDQSQSATPYLAMAEFAHALGDQSMEIKYLRYVLWFDPSDPSILDRLKSFGLIAGPSLAVNPAQ